MKRTLLYLIAAIILPQTIIAAVLVGKTEGSFSVSPSGAATYTIPIKVQKGLSDFAPSISLSYNSQASNGIAGIGWNISGLSTISAVPKSVYFDGQAKAVEEGEDNAYNLDGMRLLLKSGNNGQTGATYRTENEQYNIIKITASSNGTPATFQVKSTDGTTYKYGSSSGRHTLSNGKIYQWALDYAEDVLGNYIQYSYSQEGILYPTSITYGRNTHGTAGVDCTILFNYETRSDSISTYILGEQRYFKKRLKSIVCKYSGNIYRTYTLNYTEDNFSRLTSVTESGTSSSSLRPTTFEWEIPDFQVSCSSRSMETNILEDPDSVDFFSGDLDGDGISEIINMYTREIVLGDYTWPRVVFDGRKWNPENQQFEYCYSWDTYSGFAITGMFSTIKSCGLSMHASHGKENSLVYPFCRINNGIKSMIFNFLKEDKQLQVPMKGLSDEKEDFPLYTILDADKNGRDDIFIIEKEQHNGTYPAYLVSFNLKTQTVTSTELSLNLQGAPDKIRCADFNSDGMADVLVTTTGGYYIYWNREGSLSDSDRYYNTAFGNSNVLEAGDFNGDGLVDLIINTSESYWYIAQNTGNTTNGYFALTAIYDLISQGAQQYTGKEDKLYCLVQDMDGDGKSDAVVGYPHSSGGGGCICFLKSIGNTLILSSFHHLTNSGDYPNNTHIVQGNFDGQGGMEIMYRGKGLEQNTIGWHMLNNPTCKASSQKMISITDGLGANDSISYGFLTDGDIYSVTRNDTLPLIPLAGGIPVVKTRTESISSESRTTDYSYANGLFHLQGKGFLGFEDIRVASSTGIVTDTHCKLDSTFYVFLPRTVTHSNSSEDILSREDNLVFLRNPDNSGDRSYTISGTNSNKEDMVDGFTQGEENDYANGFPTYQCTRDDLFYTEKEITYWESPIDSIQIKGLPEEIDIQKVMYWIADDEAYEKIVYERAPSTGLILKETKRRDGQIVSTDGYSYNEYGQMTLHYTVSFNSTDTLVTRYEYYPNGKLKKEYDPKGLSKTYNYSSTLGTLTSILDFNGVQTSFTYDGMLRETKRSTPIKSCNTARVFSSYGGGVYYIKETRTGETPITTYYDAWERKISDSSPLANGVVMFRDYQYLPNGKVGFVSFPHTRLQPTSEGTSYIYDDSLKLRRIVDTNGKTSTWVYEPFQVTSCIDGVTTTTYYHTPEKIYWVEDNSGWVAYEYNADGNISNMINDDDDETCYTYDLYGRLVQTTDMNGVTKQYSYDANGYPYRTTIAGSYVETNYDKFGILRSKSWADPGELPHTVTYTYDNKFRLTKETGEGYENTYNYDTYSRITHKGKKVIDSQNELWNISFQYSGSQVTNMAGYFNTHPSTTLISEKFSYNNGYNVSDTLNNTLVWHLINQDRWGYVTGENNILGTVSHSYNDYGDMLSVVRHGNPALSESYAYNIQTGNMSSKNNIPLSYDSMNQLTGWGNQTYSYDDLGNITHQPMVGNFSYNVFKVDEMTAYNNYLIDDSLRISYYKAIERPRSIENEHYRADFYYDGNGDRYMMKVYERHHEGDSLIFTRYYMDANAEVTADTLGHYSHLYYAGGDAYTAPAVMVIDESGNTCIYQICRDNLGSAIEYANANGVRYQYSYSPWGVRLQQVGDSIVFCQPGEFPSNCPFYRTYTGHEDLWMFGLLNANARLYSPYLGRFVSPDPLLNEDGRPLDFNPYIYARNNPYRYIDRNGEFGVLVALGLSALIGGGINVAANWDNINNAGDFFMFFSVGATAGVVGAAAAVMAPAGFIAGALYGAVGSGLSGAILGGGNAAILGQDIGSAMFTGAWQGAATGFVFGGITGYFSAKANGLNGWTGKSNVMATRHRPLMTGPDELASIPNADKGLSQCAVPKGAGTTTYELVDIPYVNSRTLSDKNTTIFTRDFKGYTDRIVPRDTYHDFPFSYDKAIVQHGRSLSVGNETGYIWPGYVNGNPGFYQINVNNQTGLIYHRVFMEYKNRFDLYVGEGKNKLHFFHK